MEFGFKRFLCLNSVASPATKQWGIHAHLKQRPGTATVSSVVLGNKIYNTQSWWWTASLFLTVSLLTNSSFLCLHLYASLLSRTSLLSITVWLGAVSCYSGGTVVCRYVRHDREPSKIGWIDRDAIRGLTWVGPGNHILDGVQIPHANGQYF